MTIERASTNTPAVVKTGIEGLDDVLHGGLTVGSMYLVEGDPGAGKTTLALQFLREGAAQGEGCLYVTLSETEDELRAAARSHGWDLEGIRILELLVTPESLRSEAQYTMYHPSEVELAEATKAVLAEADRVDPKRIVFDSLSDLRLLADHPLRYRRQILALKNYFAQRQCTLLLLDDRTGEEDQHLHSVAHGVISLDRETPLFGAMRRRLEVRKMRARTFREGFHDYLIRHDGIAIFPRLVAAEHDRPFLRESASSDVPSLDALLGGGLPRGTSTLIIGAAGTGKTSVATRFAWAAAQRGERASVFLFDESGATFRERSRGLRMDIDSLDEGRLALRRIDPAELSPGQFAHDVRQEVDRHRSRVVVIDSLNGYLSAMPNERFLTLHLHELLTYLGNQGVVTILVLTQSGLLGTNPNMPVDASYIADTVILMRYFEYRGAVRQAMSVIKKRTGNHERTIREVRLHDGIQIGEPVLEVHGVLTGMTQVLGPESDDDGAIRHDGD
jgi:circadian clock protein KaiC